MTNEQQYQDYKKTRAELTVPAAALIVTGCKSPGSAAATIAALSSVLAGVMTYAANGDESILLDLIDVVSKNLRSKTTNLTTEWKAELKRHDHRRRHSGKTEETHPLADGVSRAKTPTTDQPPSAD